MCSSFRKARSLTPDSMMTKSKASPNRRAKRPQSPFIKASITGGSKIVRVAMREAKR